MDLGMHKWAMAVVRYYHPEQKENIMTNDERWVAFIVELRAYIEEHHHGANKHTDLYNRTRYYRRKMKEGKLSENKAMVLKEILNQRRMDEHTGGRKRKRIE